jgi:S-DNA-T family DNA segregation ATPase FtsK/SpoIIIE
MNDLHPIDILLLPDGDRRRIHPGTTSDTVADVAAALGSTVAGGALVVDDAVVPGRTPLALSGIGHASRIAVPGTVTDAPASSGRPVVALWVDAGPAAGGRHLLGPGRHVVGRSRWATVRVDDPALAPHQLLVDVDAGGDVAFTQLAGRLNVRADVDAGGSGALIVGASRLRFERVACAAPAERTVPAPGCVWHRPVRTIEPPPDLVAGPSAGGGDGRAPRPSGSAGAVAGLVGSVLVAAVTGQLLFLALGVVGAAAALAAGWWPWLRWTAGHRRRSRRARDLEAARLAAQRTNLALLAEHARRRIPDLAEALARVERGDPRVWERRPGHGDVAEVVLGPGRVVHELGMLEDVPVTVDLGPGAVVGLAGLPEAVAALARSLVVQRAVASGPADWRLVVVTDDLGAWSWAEWLPQATVISTAAVSSDPVDDPDPRPLVVVVTDPAVLVARTGPVRRLVSAGGASTIVLAGARRELPAWCTAVVELCADATGRVVRDPGDPLAEASTFHPAGVETVRAASAAAGLARLVDPECAPGTAWRQSQASLLELLGESASSAAAIAATWAGAAPSGAPVAPLGRTAGGPFSIDLVRDGPHALVAGTTGAGKSELLRTLAVGLAAGLGPDRLALALIDFKGGATFDALSALPHTVGVVTDLDGATADRVLRGLDAELRRREATLRDAGMADLDAYLRAGSAAPLPRLVVIVDELAVLATELPEFLHTLIDLARRGRSLGIHLVLATQRPAGVVDDHVRANTQLRIALRLHDRADALDVVGDDSAARISRRLPGRALVRLGPDELVEVQVASTAGGVARGPGRLAVRDVVGDDAGGAEDDARSAGATSELDVLVERIRAAAALTGVAPLTPPWLPPLPDRVEAVDDPSVVGLADDPDHQCRQALRWTPEPGHVVVAGGLGSGVTSALLTLARSATTLHAPEHLHLYVLDGRGDPRWAWVEGLAHVGAVVPVGDHERRHRLLARLSAEVSRRATAGGGPSIVVLIDGIGALRGALDDPDRLEEAMLFERVVADGPAVGLVVLHGTDRLADVPAAVMARAATRWVLRLADPADATLVGLRASEVPAGGPGRLRDVGSGLEAQLVVPPAGPWRVVAGRGPDPVGVLVDDVAAGSLPAGRDRADVGVELPVGLAAGDLGPAILEVPDGEPVLVVGPARSGRSTALVRLAVAWSQARPAATIAVVAPRRSPLLDVAHRRGWTVLDPPSVGGASDVGAALWVVDDAELVADLVPPAGVSVFAAVRGESLRGAFGHWTGALRRSRRGLLLGPMPELDADLLGVPLRRRRERSPVPPGRGWLVADGLAEQVHIARDP